LSDGSLEPAFVAQAISLPSEADIAREVGQDVDPDAIFAARAHLRAFSGRALEDVLWSTIERVSASVSYSPDAASAGRRSLKNACLDLLLATGAPAAIAQAAPQFETADNMTDRMAALSMLALHDLPHRTNALESFYHRFERDPLVIDKWFALQAAIPEAATLERVRALMDHPAFSIGNPNRIRSLIGSFAQANQTQFNRADGRGYEFVADCVGALNERNPQVAARLMGAFKSWRALEHQRRARAEATLRRVAAMENLSRDVADIVSRSLAEDTSRV
jgi:aminopeptidase N